MEENWKTVRNRACIRALLIFGGIILMQMLAYMLCVLFLLAQAALGNENRGMLEIMLRANTGDSIFLMAVSFVSATLSMFWCGWLYWKSDWRVHPMDYRQVFSVKNLFSVIFAGMGSCILLTVLLTLLSALLPQAFSSYNAVMEQLTDDSMLLTVLYVLLVGPVSEELIFRGAILDRFYLAFPFPLANAIQAALFGIYHMNLIQGLYAFCLGMLLGIIRRKLGSILGCMITHIVFNATSYLLGYLFPEGNTGIFRLVIVTVLGIVAFVFSFCYLVTDPSPDRERS